MHALMHAYKHVHTNIHAHTYTYTYLHTRASEDHTEEVSHHVVVSILPFNNFQLLLTCWPREQAVSWEIVIKWYEEKVSWQGWRVQGTQPKPCQEQLGCKTGDHSKSWFCDLLIGALLSLPTGYWAAWDGRTMIAVQRETKRPHRRSSFNIISCPHLCRAAVPVVPDSKVG